MRAVFDLASVPGMRARGCPCQYRAHDPRRRGDRRRPAAMIDHVSVGVRDLAQAARFYQAVLGAIGYERLEVRPHTIGFGKKYPEFWINLRAAMPPVAADSGAHVGLRVRTSELVDA